ncbi:MAG: hypothetical protein ACEPOZ_11705 [Marinifilaceae bacterium]
MKRKNILFLIAVLGMFSWYSCSQEDEGAKMSIDFVSFEKESYNLNITSDFKYLDIPVFHKNPSMSNSKLEVVVTPAEGTPTECFTVAVTQFDFSSSDTVMVKLAVDYSKLATCKNYSVSIKVKAGENLVQASPYDGKDEVVVDFVKFSPFEIDEFVGDYTLVDEAMEDTWPVVVEKADETTLRVLDAYGSGADILIKMDASDVSAFKASVELQEAWLHPDYGWVSVAGEGSFSVCEKKISLSLEHILVPYDYSFGAYDFILTKD